MQQKSIQAEVLNHRFYHVLPFTAMNQRTRIAAIIGIAGFILQIIDIRNSLLRKQGRGTGKRLKMSNSDEIWKFVSTLTIGASFVRFIFSQGSILQSSLQGVHLLGLLNSIHSSLHLRLILQRYSVSSIWCSIPPRSYPRRPRSCSLGQWRWQRRRWRSLLLLHKS